MKAVFSIFGLGLIASIFTIAVPVSARANEQVYQKLIPSAAAILVKLSDGKLSQGSGVLVNAEKRWVVANYHVVRDESTAAVIFPVRMKGKVISDGKVYTKDLAQLAVRGRVIVRDVSRDLAVIELPKLPSGVHAVPLAADSAAPGQTVHLIGNPATEEGLWLYSFGKVRQVYHKTITSTGPGGFKMKLDCQVVLSTLAVNPGDSGGPVVNDKGELVAVTHGNVIGSNAMSMLIDISEIRAMLDLANKSTVAQKGAA
jgi:S1-C subfamily serine protease